MIRSFSNSYCCFLMFVFTLCASGFCGGCGGTTRGTGTTLVKGILIDAQDLSSISEASITVETTSLSGEVVDAATAITGPDGAFSVELESEPEGILVFRLSIVDLDTEVLLDYGEQVRDRELDVVLSVNRETGSLDILPDVPQPAPAPSPIPTASPVPTTEPVAEEPAVQESDFGDRPAWLGSN